MGKNLLKDETNVKTTIRAETQIKASVGNNFVWEPESSYFLTIWFCRCLRSGFVETQRCSLPREESALREEVEQTKESDRAQQGSAWSRLGQTHSEEFWSINHTHHRVIPPCVPQNQSAIGCEPSREGLRSPKLLLSAKGKALEFQALSCPHSQQLRNGCTGLAKRTGRGTVGVCQSNGPTLSLSSWVFVPWAQNVTP